MSPTPCDLVVRGGTIVTVDPDSRVLDGGAIAIRDGRILSVDSWSSVSERYDAARLIEARGTVITPGLVNAHVHLSQHLLRGCVPDDTPPTDYLLRWAFPYYAALTEEDEHLAVVLGCCDLLSKGITLVAEAGTVRFRDAAVHAVRRSGIRCVMGAWSWDLVEDLPALRWSTDEALAVVEALLADLQGDDADRVLASASIIGMGTCSDELVHGAKVLADRYGAVLNMHQSATREELDHHRRRELGVAPIRHLDDLGALGRNVRLVHATFVDEEEVALLAARGTAVVHCDTALLKMGEGALRHSRVPEMLAAGIPVAIGTDTVNVSNTNDVLRAAHLAALVYKDARADLRVLPAEQAIRMCTIDGARSLGLEDRLGSLEAGKRADLVLFDASRPEWLPMHDVVNNLVYSADGGSVDTVLVGGEVVVERGRPVTVDLAGLGRDCQDAARRVTERAGIAPAPRWPVST
jgi:cytosine/adenosine deaminase-related metal-dependent hydrolase